MAINPHVRIETHAVRLGADNVDALVAGHDLVLDGSDNFATRFLVSDACHRVGRTLVSAAVGQFDGQLAVFKSHLRAEGRQVHPCYRCLNPEPPPPGSVPSCTEAGILGALTGVMGSMQALEALKEILGIGESLAGRLLLYDGLGGLIRTVTLNPDPACPVCGAAARA